MLTPFDPDGRLDLDGFDALVDWYVQRGAAGLFAGCSSSEVEQLDAAEMLRLTARAVQRAAGRVQVIGAVMGRPDARRWGEAIAAVAATGVDAVVLNLAALVEADEDESALRGALDTLTRDPAAAGVALGIYECPTPYHRLIGTPLLGELAATGRFVFFKDTCCDGERLIERLDAVRGTPLRLYNAHTPLMSRALAHGGAGFCGIGTNFYPPLYDALQAAHARGDDEAARRLQAFLDRWDPAVHRGYPRSAKAWLKRQGLPLTTHCRRPVTPATDEPDPLSRLGDELDPLTTSLDRLSSDPVRLTR
jgi:4-hydroxy-tetrahydrodipicolinate synthase